MMYVRRTYPATADIEPWSRIFRNRTRASVMLAGAGVAPSILFLAEPALVKMDPECLEIGTVSIQGLIWAAQATDTDSSVPCMCVFKGSRNIRPVDLAGPLFTMTLVQVQRYDLQSQIRVVPLPYLIPRSSKDQWIQWLYVGRLIGLRKWRLQVVIRRRHGRD